MAELFIDIQRLEIIHSLIGPEVHFHFGHPCPGCRPKANQFLQGLYARAPSDDQCAICGMEFSPADYSPPIARALSQLIWPDAPEWSPHLDLDDLRESLRRLRLELANADGVPAYVVFDNRSLDAIANLRPHNGRELLDIPGIGPAKLEKYGGQILAHLDLHRQKAESKRIPSDQ